MFGNFGCVICIVMIALFPCCIPDVAPQSDGLSKPYLEFVELTAVPAGNGLYTEAVHLQWTMSIDEYVPVHSFTLLRKLPDDSAVDVFTGSRLIPPDTGDFFDALIDYTFPKSGFDSIVYRIVAIDTFGQAGDTSDNCVVLIAPQPNFIQMQNATGCCSWESWIRGGVFSWCTICRKGEEGTGWTSDQFLEFPLTDQSAKFSACVPDSLLPLDNGIWYYTLFVKAAETHSITTGTINVP